MLIRTPGGALGDVITGRARRQVHRSDASRNGDRGLRARAEPRLGHDRALHAQRLRLHVERGLFRRRLVRRGLNRRPQRELTLLHLDSDYDEMRHGDVFEEDLRRACACLESKIGV